MRLVKAGWFISTKGGAYGHVDDRIRSAHGGLEMNLLGRKWLRRFLIFRRAGGA
jgi:hypothetical protein